jgi:magnesium chelatase subunit D
MTRPDLRSAARGFPPQVVGLRREREVLTVALEAGRHVVLEGPPGTGKSTLLRHIAGDLGTSVVFVEGNAELTPARLIGQYDPAQVLAEGYVAASFTDGPLLEAMRAGALLYLEEFNRVPEETLNVLITVLTEGEIAVPRLGLVQADPGFRLIAAMNPFDAIGTARVSHAIADRICRVVLGYQSARAERRITALQTSMDGLVVDFAVALTRLTREHPDVRMGSSVRGAIDLVLLLTGLMRLRAEDALTRETARDAVHAALSGRIRIADGCDRMPEAVLDELLARLWPPDAKAPELPEADSDDADDLAAASQDGQGKADGPPPGAGQRSSRSSLRRDRQAGSPQRTTSRAELASQHAGFADVSPDTGTLDEDALARLLSEDPDAAAWLLADLTRATDAALRAAARRLAARLFVQLAAVGVPARRGVARISAGRPGEGDLDLERTIAGLSGTWPPATDQIATRAWQARRRAVVLLVDASGSMSGQALALAAVATAGVVLAADSRLEPGVLAFSGTVTMLQRRGARRAPQDVIGELIALRGHGMTDLAAALRAAAAQLAGAAGDREVILLSDCLATSGGDPSAALAGIDRLHVLSPLPAADALAAGTALARAGGGLCQPVSTLSQLGPALNRVLARG